MGVGSVLKQHFAWLQYQVNTVVWVSYFTRILIIYESDLDLLARELFEEISKLSCRTMRFCTLGLLF